MVKNNWEGTNTGLDYWTDIFLAFTHAELIFHWLKDHQGAYSP